MARTKHMKPVEEMLAEKREQLARLQIEIQTLEAALRRASGEAEVPQRGRRTNVKQILLDLLKERGEAGLNAGLAVELAAKKGERIERATVSSLLSRFKSDGLVTYDSILYRLAQPSDAHKPTSGGADALH